MQIDIQKAYQYYIDNITRSCDVRILDEQSFHQAFSHWILTLQLKYASNNPTYFIDIHVNENCQTSRYLNLDIVLKKIK